MQRETQVATDDAPTSSDLTLLWQRLASAKLRRLALDYDGTLAPFVSERMHAYALDGIFEQLQKLVTLNQTQLVIVSGRPLAELTQLITGLEIDMIGSHGFEWKPAAEPARIVGLDQAAQRHLADLFAATQKALPELTRRNRIELKPGSIAVHTRGCDHKQARQTVEILGRVWQPQRADFETRTFNGGLEYCATGVNKGTALNWWLDTIYKTSTGSPAIEVYIGDDRTDEDAFVMLRERENGLAIKVGPGETAAHLRVADCHAVRGLLFSWVAHEQAAARSKPEYREVRSG